MEQISTYRTVVSMTRGFFDGFFTGLLDGGAPAGSARRTPQTLKQLVAAHYGHLAHYFNGVMVPLLLALRFDGFEEARQDMQRRHFSDATPLKVMLRYACGSKKLYEVVTDNYRLQLEALLTGHFQTLEQHFGRYGHCLDAETVDVGRAVRAVVRATMQSYVAGLKAGAEDAGTAFRQAAVLRMVAESMASLFHNENFDVWEDAESIGLEGVFMRACTSETLFNMAVNEMNEALL
jgi:hypothetical protein